MPLTLHPLNYVNQHDCLHSCSLKPLSLMFCSSCLDHIIIIISQRCVYSCMCLLRGYANLHAAIAWYSLWRGGVAPGGMRQTQKGIITFLPKHRNSMNYLRYTRQAPRQLREWTTQDSVREPGGQGPAGEPGGISGDPEVTSEGKLNDKNTERRCRTWGPERTSIHRFCWNVCVRSRKHVPHRHAQVNPPGSTHL